MSSTTIPVEAKSFPFTPPVLEKIEKPPVFVLRHGTRRDRHTYQDEVALRGLRSYSKRDFREATIEELKAKWTSDTMPIGDVIDALERYFSAADEFEAALEGWQKASRKLVNAAPEGKRATLSLPPMPEMDFDPVEREKVENLLADIEDRSERIRRMNRDNIRRERETRRLALAILLQSTSLDIPLSRNMDGLIEDASLLAIEDKLDQLSPEDAGYGLAFGQLGTEALLAFFLTGEQEKNSESPDATTSGENGSTGSDKPSSTMETSASKTSDGAPIPASSSPNENSE